MKGIFRSKITLIFIYIIMAAVAVYLNWSSENRDLPTIIVTAVMFVIVLVIFCFAFGRFARIDSMIRDLKEASAQIREDYRASGTYLWESYKNRDVIFTNRILGKRYAEFKDEMDRLQALSGDLYHCDIEDYINHDLIDDTISRNVLNLVSGTMTGLGILGTFIGLSLGLQQFNTGTADEITTSIGPLIQGIKVAFHTSIYGMVFSLFFSFIYKNKMDQAYEALERFLEAYENFVLPDSKNESFRQLLSFEKRQTEGMNEIAGTFASEISAKVNEIMTPQFDRMNHTIENFARVASEAQVEGVERIVDKFIEQMNRSLSGTMLSLSSAIRETVEWQQQDRTYMRNILNEISRLTNDTVRVNNMVDQSLEHMTSYVSRLDELQGYVAQDLAGIEKLISENTDATQRTLEHLEMLSEYEKQIGAFSEEFSRAAAQQLEATNEASRQGIEAVTEAAKRGIDSMEQASQSAVSAAESAVGNIAAASEKNLKNAVRTTDAMTGGMEDAAKNLADAADTLGGQVTKSLNATIESYNRMQEELESMIYAVDVLRRNTAAMNQLKQN